MIDWNQAVNNYILSKERQSEPVEPNVFRCSSLSGCVRSCVKTRTNQQKFGIETLKHFEIGTILHKFLQQDVALGHVGVPIELEKQFEFESNGIKFIGHADCVTAEAVYDFKSTSNLQTTLTYPVSLGYIYQLSAYCYGLHKQQAILVYIDKRNLAIGQKEVAIIPLETITSFCRQVMLAEKHYKETGELPPPCSECFNCKREKGYLK
jgi:hypothetical protein